MVLGVQNVQNPRGRHGCVEHMVAPQASVQAALGQCASRTKVVLVQVNGAVLRGLGMVLAGVQHVHNACDRQCCVEHMVALQASW